MKVRSLLLSLAFLFSASSLSAKVIIWDLGDVLFEKSSFGFMKHIGLSRLLGHIFFDWKNPWKLDTLIFEVMSGIECDPLPDGVHCYTAHGKPLPPILCHWQAGTILGHDIAKKAKNHIDVLHQTGFFVSRREKKLVEKAVTAMFDPHLLAQNMKPIKAGVRLLEQCAQERNPDGTLRNYIIALSNWDPTSFDLFHRLNHKVFQHFDDLIISGKTGRIKPRPAAFEYLIERHRLDPEECLFIDDREENLLAAEALGFNTFHVNKGNYKELKQVLADFGALIH